MSFHEDEDEEGMLGPSMPSVFIDENASGKELKHLL